MKPPFAVIVALSFLPSLAAADDWSHTQDFQPAQTASIRVVEPEGYKVTINGRTESVPVVIPLNNADNYVAVRFAAPDGATWDKKIEVKRFKETVIRVKHAKSDVAAPPKAPPAPKAASYVGTIRNTTDNCDGNNVLTIKVDFLMGPDLVKSAEVKPGARTNVELTVGAYNVRRYRLEGQQWVFDKTEQNYPVDKDGWYYEWGCPKRRR